jgi:Flp pilus assembly protein TadG
MARAARGQQGSSVVEFALISPIFLLLLFGILEFGLVMYSKGIITQAGREGARFGVVYSTPPKSAAQIQTQVQDYLTGAGFTGPVTITVTGAGGAKGAPLGVKVAYTYQYLVLPNFVTSLGGNLNLSTETVMLME